MNTFLSIAKMLALLPYLLMGIEQVHADAPGSTKKQLALESLGLASNAATAILPGKQAEITAATQLASTAIDAVVSTANQLGVFKKAIK